MFVTCKVKRLFRDSIQVYRCITCENLATERSESLSHHGGHRVKQPVNVSLIEWVAIQIGMIR